MIHEACNHKKHQLFYLQGGANLNPLGYIRIISWSHNKRHKLRVQIIIMAKSSDSLTRSGVINSEIYYSGSQFEPLSMRSLLMAINVLSTPQE